jgi:hypothetical protein
MATKGRRESLRHDRSDQAVDVSHARADRDQREHVEVARHERLPAANEERPARPQHDRCRKHELDPVRQCRVDPVVRTGEMAAHFQNHRRRGEHRANPETASHVEQFGIGGGIEACDLRLQRHAADRAGAGSDLADLRMHRAGVDPAGGNVGLGRGSGFVEICAGVGGEFGAATGRAEMKGLALVSEAML